jgi:hypothetical protein
MIVRYVNVCLGTRMVTKMNVLIIVLNLEIMKDGERKFTVQRY